VAYRVGDWLEENDLPAEEWKAIEEMTEAQALTEVLDAAEQWDSEVNESIFQELSEEEQEGYALANVRHEKAIEIVRAMIKARKEPGNERT
jgi:hypothetical protein